MTKIPAHILPLARAAAAKVWRDADGHNEARRIEEGENDGFAVKVAAAAIQAEQERHSRQMEDCMKCGGKRYA